jgi:NADPH:quinone reductase-like Zn-dependent oxidoreductase
MVAGSYVQRELECLALDGRLVLIATLGGASGPVNFSDLMRRRLTVTGSSLRPRPVAFKAAIALCGYLGRMRKGELEDRVAGDTPPVRCLAYISRRVQPKGWI